MTGRPARPVGTPAETPMPPNGAEPPKPPAEPQPNYVYTPSDNKLSHVYDKLGLPQVKQYRELVEAENRVDMFLRRKFLDMQETAMKVPRKTTVVRLFISNSCENQPWQVAAQRQKEQEMRLRGEQPPPQPPAGPPMWNLRVEGRPVSDEPADLPTRRKFSSFFTSMVIELMPESGTEYPEGNIVEWHEAGPGGQKSVDFDGMDVRRSGVEEVKVRVTLQPKEIPEKLVVANEDLRLLLGISVGTQQEIVALLWQYIKLYNLQEPEDSRLVKTDAALRKIFGVDKFHFPQVVEMLTAFLKAQDPIVVEYVVKTNVSSTMGETVYDLEIENDELANGDLLRAIEAWNENDKEIVELENKISLSIAKLNDSYFRQQFYEQLSADPVRFLRNWLDVQARNLKVLNADEGFMEETVRSSDFYTDELLDENIHLLLNSKRV